MNEVYEFLKACGTYYLATVDNGEPRVRPFGTIDCWDGKLTIQTGLKKDVAKQMLACPKVEISATSPDGGRWIRLTADAALVEDIAAAEHMLEAYPSPRRRQHRRLRPHEREGRDLLLHRRTCRIPLLRTDPESTEQETDYAFGNQ